MRTRLVYTGLMAASLLVVACDPPGKPQADDPQAENRELVTDFQTLYESNCAGCHGAEGKFGAARTLNQPLYLAILSKDELRKIVRGGRPGTSMPAWAKSQGGPLTDKQVEVLANSIYSNWAKPQSFASVKLPAYSGESAMGDAGNGKRLFLKDCFLCHGKGAMVGSVTDASYASLVSNQYLRSAILAGRPDLGMPDYRALGLGHMLSEKDIADLVAYLASFRPPEAEARMQAAIALQTRQQNEGTK
jgi:cytochrome c oxidase cbb3-type subunit III